MHKDMHKHNTTGGKEAAEIIVKGFCNSLTIDNCINIKVICDGVIESVQASNSAMVHIHVHACVCVYIYIYIYAHI